MDMLANIMEKSGSVAVTERKKQLPKDLLGPLVDAMSIELFLIHLVPCPNIALGLPSITFVHVSASANISDEQLYTNRPILPG